MIDLGLFNRLKRSDLQLIDDALEEHETKLPDGVIYVWSKPFGVDIRFYAEPQPHAKGKMFTIIDGKVQKFKEISE